ncbi:unnamed protein product [Calypogeia fissa]
MDLVLSSNVNMIGPDEGITLWAVGVLVTLKALSNETGGAYSLSEVIVPPGLGPPTHMHTREEETFYMINGELIWNVGSKSFHATNGCFVHLPRNVPHSFINVSKKPAKMVVTYAPGGFEQFYLKVGELVSNPSAPGEPSPTTPDLMKKAMTIAEEYGLVFVGPIANDEHSDEL